MAKDAERSDDKWDEADWRDARCKLSAVATYIEGLENFDDAMFLRRLSSALPFALPPSGEKAEKDEAYRQRNVLVAALARMYPSGTRRTNIEGWSEDWHGCVYIDLPSGQISYHYHDSQAHLFAGLPPYTKAWDNHSKADVESRLARLSASAATEEPKKRGDPAGSCNLCGNAMFFYMNHNCRPDGTAQRTERGEKG